MLPIFHARPPEAHAPEALVLRRSVSRTQAWGSHTLGRPQAHAGRFGHFSRAIWSKFVLFISSMLITKAEGHPRAARRVWVCRGRGRRRGRGGAVISDLEKGMLTGKVSTSTIFKKMVQPWMGSGLSLEDFQRHGHGHVGANAGRGLKPRRVWCGCSHLWVVVPSAMAGNVHSHMMHGYLSEA